MERPLPIRGDRPLVHLALLGATLITTYATYLFSLSSDRTDLLAPVLFAVSVVTILGAHEMGHYVAARLHGVQASLPYFIPVPLLGFGTLGAVIDIRGKVPSRRALLDIGASGPLVGIVVALPILVYGLAHSRIGATPRIEDVVPTDQSLIRVVEMIGEYLRQRFDGTWEPTTQWVTLYRFEDSLLVGGLKRWLIGELPANRYVILHPMALAGWFGLLVTVLNLCPIGTLDGGHIAFALFGDRARWIGRGAAVFLFVLTMVFSAGWLIWFLFATKLIGLRHPGVELPTEPLSRTRWAAGLLSFAVLVLCFTPVPVRIVPW